MAGMPCDSCGEMIPRPVPRKSEQTGEMFILCHECAGEKKWLQRFAEANRTEGQRHGMQHTRS